jgi:hypothetical protein
MVNTFRLIRFALLAPILHASFSTPATAGPPTPPPVVCLDGACLTATVAASSIAGANATKWHPGWYVQPDARVMGYPTFKWQPESSYYSSLPSYISGVSIQIAWRAVETDYNVYNTAWLKQQLDWAKAAGKRVFVNIWPMKITDSTTTFPLDSLPPYLQNEPYGGSQAERYGTVAKIWRPEVADRFIALGAKICQQFDGHSHFEGIMLPENSFAPDGSVDPQFSLDNLNVQLKRIAKGIRDACPHTLVTSRWNWASPSTNKSLAAFAEQNGLGIGSTDMGPFWITDMDLTLKGAGVVQGMPTATQNGLNWGTIDYRGRIPIIGASEYAPFMKDVCMSETISYVNNVYKATHALMNPQEEYSGALACQQKTAMFSAIQQQGPIANKACPTSLVARGGCKTD